MEYIPLSEQQRLEAQRQRELALMDRLGFDHSSASPIARELFHGEGHLQYLLASMYNASQDGLYPLESNLQEAINTRLSQEQFEQHDREIQSLTKTRMRAQGEGLKAIQQQIAKRLEPLIPDIQFRVAIVAALLPEITPLEGQGIISDFIDTESIINQLLPIAALTEETMTELDSCVAQWHTVMNPPPPKTLIQRTVGLLRPTQPVSQLTPFQDVQRSIRSWFQNDNDPTSIYDLRQSVSRVVSTYYSMDMFDHHFYHSFTTGFNRAVKQRLDR